MKRALAFLFLASAALHAAAQTRCTADETPLQCWRDFNGVPAATAKAVATTNTGSPTAATQVTATALRDFASLFSASVDTGTIIQNTTSVTVDWNAPFPFVEDNDRLKFQTIFTDPVLGDDVVTPLGANAESAKNSLTNFDDVTALLYYDAVNKRFGRSIAPHIELLHALDTAPMSAAAVQLLAKYLSDHQITGFSTTKPFSETVTDPTQQQEVITLVENAARAEQSSLSSSAAMVRALTRLINNQPQLYAGAIYRYRKPLIGPDEVSLRATFELSPNSLNQFLRRNAAVCSTAALTETASGSANATTCTSRLVAAANALDATQPNANDRLAFAIEYRQSRGESVDLTSFGVTPPATPVVRQQAHSVIGSLTWGHPLSGQRLKDARLDFAANYENVSNDPTKTNRFVATLTFSQKVSDTVTFPLSVVYANHATDLASTSKRLGVHFGVAYKIPNQ